MAKDAAKVTKYLESLKDRLSGPVPTKHKDHPETFKTFLKGEIATATKQLEAAKLDVKK